MKTTALIEKGKDGTYGIYNPDIDSTIIGEGTTELHGIEFEYKYDVASVFNYFDFINVTKFAKWAGINGGLMRAYKSCDTYISEKQAKKIEEALRRIGRELSAISL